MRLGFKVLGKLVVKYISTYTKGTLKQSVKDLLNDAYAMLLCFLFFLILFYKCIRSGYSFELHRQVDAIQMGTHNICLYKEVDEKYTDCDLKTTELLYCALIGVFAVIRSNTVFVSGKTTPRVSLWSQLKACAISMIFHRLLSLFSIKIVENAFRPILCRKATWSCPTASK